MLLSDLQHTISIANALVQIETMISHLAHLTVMAGIVSPMTS